MPEIDQECQAIEIFLRQAAGRLTWRRRCQTLTVAALAGLAVAVPVAVPTGLGLATALSALLVAGAVLILKWPKSVSLAEAALHLDKWLGLDEKLSSFLAAGDSCFAGLLKREAALAVRQQAQPPWPGSWPETIWYLPLPLALLMAIGLFNQQQLERLPGFSEQEQVSQTKQAGKKMTGKYQDKVSPADRQGQAVKKPENAGSRGDSGSGQSGIAGQDGRRVSGGAGKSRSDSGGVAAEVREEEAGFNGVIKPAAQLPPSAEPDWAGFAAMEFDIPVSRRSAVNKYLQLLAEAGVKK